MKTFTKTAAAALVAAVMSTGALAAEVTVSGIVDAYVEAYTAGNETVGRLSSGGDSGNRFAFKGTEQISDGMTAFFRLEGGLNIDNGTSTGPNSGAGYIFQREAVLGLRGTAGTLTAGYQYTPHFLTMLRNDCTPGMSLGSGLGAFGTPGKHSVNGIVNAAGGTTRMKNSIQYETPDMAGLKVQIFAGLGENGDSSTEGNFYNIATTYANGPFRAGLSVAWWKDPVVAGLMYEDTLFEAFGATYDFGVTKLGVQLEARQSDDVNIPDNFAGAVSARTPILGGFLNTSVGYYRAEETAGENASAVSWGVRYDYPFSKRTNMYVGWTGVQNKDAATMQLSAGGGSSAAPTIATAESGLANNTVFMGMCHRF